MKSPEGYIKIHISLDPDHYNKLFNHSLATKVTMQKIIRQIIRRWLEEHYNSDRPYGD